MLEKEKIALFDMVTTDLSFSSLIESGFYHLEKEFFIALYDIILFSSHPDYRGFHFWRRGKYILIYSKQIFYVVICLQ